MGTAGVERVSECSSDYVNRCSKRNDRLAKWLDYCSKIYSCKEIENMLSEWIEENGNIVRLNSSTVMIFALQHAVSIAQFILPLC